MVDVDIRPGLAFDALPALQKEDVDVVISSDPENLVGVEFTRFLTTRRFLLPQKPV